MPINTLPKETPRGRGPEPNHAFSEKEEPPLAAVEEPSKEKPLLAAGVETSKEKESDLADQETQALWESQEVGGTSWSGQGGDRYSDPE